MEIKKILFLMLMLICFLPQIDPAVSLALGIIFSLSFGNPLSNFSSSLGKRLLQISVIGLGFGIGISSVLHEGEKSIVYTSINNRLVFGTGLPFTIQAA